LKKQRQVKAGGQKSKTDATTSIGKMVSCIFTVAVLGASEAISPLEKNISVPCFFLLLMINKLLVGIASSYW